MQSFTWNKHFITGLPEIDQQHQHLVDIINQFGAQQLENEVAFEDIENLVQELAAYAQYHFREEEALMTRSGVDPRHLNLHLEAHNGFLRDTISMQTSLSSDNPDTARHLLEFLIHWLAYHILGTDQYMATQIKEIESGKTASEAYEIGERLRNDGTEPLLEALNGLFEQVSARNKSLIQLNHSLEERIAGRTRELSEANLLLEELALTDSLTGLPNRRHAMRQIEQLWEEHEKSANPLVCMMVDADYFKEINDTHGHETGDMVLQTLAMTLRHSVRSDDIVCRLGGDEFLIICPDTDQEGGLYLAEQTRKTVSKLCIEFTNGNWQGSISLGVAAKSVEMKTYSDLIRLADRSVYAAKRDGKNCVRSITT